MYTKERDRESSLEWLYCVYSGNLLLLFVTWFSLVFPRYNARLAYCKTAAVMSMVGYILGLGDRHGENILFDSTSGDCVHVDFNCLFNRVSEPNLVSNLFLPNQIAVFFEKLNFYFIKTANIPVYGNIAVYGNIVVSV